MSQTIVIFDPTQADKASAVRGIGRYISLYKEAFPQWHYTTDLSSLSPQNTDVLINPFINFLHQPVITHPYAKKQIGVIHDLIALKYPTHFPAGITGKIALWRNRLALSTYDLILTDSQASKNDVLSFFHLPEEKVRVVYPCLARIYNSELRIQNKNKSKTNAEFSILNSQFFLYVGDATWNKNLVHLAKAVSMTKIPCIFVGKVFEQKDKYIHLQKPNSIWEKELFSFFQLVQNNDLYIFPGYVSDEELVSLYQKTLCNILVSRDEGFGFSYLEAASQGSPSLLSDIFVFHEIAEDAAFYCNEKSTEDIAKQLAYIATHEEERKEIGFKAQLRSKEYTQERFIEEISQIITNVSC